MIDNPVASLPLAFLLAMAAAEASGGGEHGVSRSMDSLQPGSLSSLIEVDAGELAGSRRLLPHLAQYFPNFPNFPNFQNFHNCFNGMWRNC